MSLIKYSSTEDFKFDEVPVQLITEQQQLIKRAADVSFKYAADKKKKDQTDLHVIALGSYDGYGANRNLDSWTAKDCEEYHPTFLRAWGMPDGRGVCRNHKNKKTDPRYGTIKESAFNGKMKRVELLIGLDNDTCGDEIQKIAEGKQIAFSMACKVAYDVCSECGHKSYDGDGDKEKGIPDDRCTCIKTRLGDITKTGNIIHMLNPSPNWGELSIVGRPACRIAYSIKAAHDLGIAPKVAFLTPEIEEVPDNLKISKKANDRLSLVRKLAAIEKRVAAVGGKASKESLARISADRDDLSKETIEELRSIDPSKLLKVLADNGIIFKPSEFMSYLFDNKVKPHHVDGMKSHLPDIFSQVEKSKGGEVTNNDRFNPSDIGSVIKSVMQMVSGLKERHSFEEGPSSRRIMQITIVKGPQEKKASLLEKTSSIYDRKLAEQYCAYKLAALNYIDEQGKLTDSLMLNSVWQNRL